jgi:hypothetical protein
VSAIQVKAVEISGWDAEGQFFVEVADMNVDERSGSSVSLCHRIESGSLLFVRPVLHLGEANRRAHPVANEARRTDLPDAMGRWRIQLSPCEPRNLGVRQ